MANPFVKAWKYLTALFNAKIDEHADPKVQIQQAMRRLMEGRTCFVIAHRLSTIQHADRILVMENGAVIEEGDHNGLLAGGGHYATLYNTYFRHQPAQTAEYVEQAREMAAGAGEE